MQQSTPASEPKRKTLDDKLKELQQALDETTTDIDIDNNKKDYLNNSIKDLTGKKTEIDKIVGDYEKEFNNITEKDDALQSYVVKKKPSDDDVGEYRKKGIEKIKDDVEKDIKYNDIKDHLDDLIKGNPMEKRKSLKELKNDLWKAQNNLTIKQKIYEEYKTQIKDCQKELTNKPKKLDEFKNSVDGYFNDKEHKLAELYFSIDESKSFSDELHKDFEKPIDIRKELETDCEAVINALTDVNIAEGLLKKTLSEIDTTKKKFEGLKAERLTKILDKITKLGTCETPETSTNPEISTNPEAYES